MAKAEKFALKITSAITLDGAIVTAGKVIEVDEKTAKNLLHRGKAELASDKKPEKAKGPIGTDGKGGAKAQGNEPADEKGDK